MNLIGYASFRFSREIVFSNDWVILGTVVVSCTQSKSFTHSYHKQLLIAVQTHTCIYIISELEININPHSLLKILGVIVT